MAYVMNPFSYKLGYSLSWSDNWYSNKKLYPIILQTMLTIRYFLIYFWTSRNLEKLDTYLSHISLMLNSGRLLINLFFYEAKINDDNKNSHRLLKSIVGSIPYSKSTPEVRLNDYWSGSSVPLRTRARDSIRNYFFFMDPDDWTWESQRFFLFFQFLGLDPGSLLLEFYLHYGRKRKNFDFILKYDVEKRRFKKLDVKIFIHRLEFVFLERIYRFINNRVFYFWLFKKEKNLNMVRFLRSLFFYGGMPYFGKKYRHLSVPLKHGLKTNINYLNYLKKKKLKKKLLKKKNSFKLWKFKFWKIQVLSLFSLLKLNWKKLLKNYNKTLNRKNFLHLLKYTFNNIKEDQFEEKASFHLEPVEGNVNKITKSRWKFLKKKRSKNIKSILRMRKKKIKLINEIFGFSQVQVYTLSEQGSTKLDAWHGNFLNKMVPTYLSILNRLRYNRTKRGRKIHRLTRFHYYRIFYNFFGRFYWFYNLSSFDYYIDITTYQSRYAFFNEKNKELYRKFLDDILLKYKVENNQKIFNYLTQFYKSEPYFSKYLYWLKNLNYSITTLLWYQRTSFWCIFDNYWDYRKIYPEALKRNLPNLDKFFHAKNIPWLHLADAFVDLDLRLWKKYDACMIALKEFLYNEEKVYIYSTLFNKSVKLKKMLHNSEMKKKKKNSLLWKTKLWLKYNNNVSQMNSDYLFHLDKFKNVFETKKIFNTNLFVPYKGSLNLIEKKSNFLKNWYTEPKFDNNKYLFKQKNVNKKFNKFKNYKMYIDYIFFKNNNNKKLQVAYKIFNKIKNNNLYKKKNVNKFKKLNKKYSKSRLLNLFKKNKKFFFKWNLTLKDILLKKKKKKINKIIKKKKSWILKFLDYLNYLKKINVKKRKNLIKKGLKALFKIKKYKKYKKKKKKYILFNHKGLITYDPMWNQFVFSRRNDTFKWRIMNEYIRKDEEGKFDPYYFFKYLKKQKKEKIDFTSVVKKLKKQQYPDDFLEKIIQKFKYFIMKRREIFRKNKKKKKLNYGIHLYKYFNDIKYFKKYWHFVRMQKQFITLRYIRVSYARLFFIFWFISLRVERQVEPQQMYLYKHYGSEHLYEFGSLFFLYLAKKPFYEYFGYYVRSIIMYWLGIYIDFKYTIVTNNSLSAEFIATHIGRALFLGLAWREVIKPIRNDLNFLLTKLRVLEKRPLNKYFTKFNDYERFESSLYEYSSIYIKLHLKNYLSSFNIFWTFKLVLFNLKYFYFFRFFCYKGFYRPRKYKILFFIKRKKFKYTNFKKKLNKKLNKKFNRTKNKPYIVYYVRKRKRFKREVLFSLKSFSQIFFKLKYYYFFLLNKNIINKIFLLKQNYLNILNNKKIFFINKLLTYQINKFNVKCYFNVYKFFLLFKKYNKNLFLKKIFLLYLKKNLYKKFFFFTVNKRKLNVYFFFKWKKLIYKSWQTVHFPIIKSIKFTRYFRKFFLKSRVYKYLKYRRKFKKAVGSEYDWLRVYKSAANNYKFAYFMRLQRVHEILASFKFVLQNNLKFYDSFLYYQRILYTISKKINKYYNFTLFQWLNFLKLHVKFLKFNNNNNKNKFLWKNCWRNTINTYCNEDALYFFNTYVSDQLRVSLVFSNFLYKGSNLMYLSKQGYKTEALVKPYGWIYNLYFSMNCLMYTKKLLLKKYLYFFLLKYFINIFLFKLFSYNLKFKNYINKLKFFYRIRWYLIYLFELNFKKKKNKIKIKFELNLFNSNKWHKNFIFFKMQFYLKNHYFFFFLKELLGTLFLKSNIINAYNHFLFLPDLKLKSLLEFKKFDHNLLKIIDENVKKKKKISKYSAIIKKKTFVEYFFQNKFLLGYKFRFAGRFKRRRKRSIMWLKKGLNPISSHDSWIDYGCYETANRFSKFSIRIWLHRNKDIRHKNFIRF